ncbi:MAG: PP2C family protein-serine/threonine phosphatase [Gomphosphaeria aponina SAG 52.96 = DSM 107014]|uniref:PP2C family protein-serine/threonine phosphatase n=1 Tax=Gomphosphaeria aponina SAG 52.96 = DSM 107014 TaxID=1521640 RepID=A0A941GUZ7_9CHRO|nr:PP2C family protein-serine/threonine phosphatase [Gomphosphaeria aponina SAG 52.96 = DSM 107014]
MTALPTPWSYQNANSINNGMVNEATPILALKELVANLQREQNKIQNLLSSLGFALRSFNNLNQFLELTPLMAARVTDADGGALIMFDSKGQVRLEQIYCHDSQTCKNLRWALEQITDKITPHDHKILLGESFPKDLDEQIRVYLGETVQVFGTGVLVKNAEKARLYIISRNPEYCFSPTRRKLVQLVADQTAVAIANHELTVELRQKERQDRELEIASEIQLRLLPRKCPTIKGVKLAAQCKTASRVGGDYYDFIPTNYDQLNPQLTSVPWSIVIGDVMGKGVPAGLIMTMTRGMLRAEVLNRHSPARILQHLNRVMYADLENSHRFVTLFYSEYDPETGILSYSNAAHNPPLWWQAKSGKIERLDTWGMLVGLDINSEYEDAQVKLEPGDTIMYYTDGFTDAMSPNGDRFDEQNLTAAFQWACENCSTTQAILDYLFQQVQIFIGSGNNNIDDMTIIVMQIQPSYP